MFARVMHAVMHVTLSVHAVFMTLFFSQYYSDRSPSRSGPSIGVLNTVALSEAHIIHTIKVVFIKTANRRFI